MKIPNLNNYLGQLGEYLVQYSPKIIAYKYITGTTVLDGHPALHGFTNIDITEHLDLLFLIPNKSSAKLIKVIEVKTTRNKTKKSFQLNGQCGKSLEKVLKQGDIEVELAVVRLKNYAPLYDISKKSGFSAETIRLIEHPELYTIEYYTKKQLKITNKSIKII